ncbi:hypothetical protein SHIRM173S_12116 [Streptomyces hirsutus]
MPLGNRRPLRISLHAMHHEPPMPYSVAINVEQPKGSWMLKHWIRWILISAVIVIFWLGLLTGHWLPLGGPQDEAIRWSIATALASAISAVGGMPLVRWAEGKGRVTKEQ